MLTMTCVGRIGRDVELRRIPSGESVCNVVIACNYGKRDDDLTQWIDGSLWGARAEALAEYLTKGKQVILVLKDVHIETYEGSNGPGAKLMGNIQELEFGASPQGEQGGGQQRQQQRGRGNDNRGNDTRGQGGARDNRSHGGGQQRNSYAEGRGRQQPAERAAAPAPAQRSGGSSGFDDMDDDIPFMDPLKRRGYHLAI